MTPKFRLMAALLFGGTTLVSSLNITTEAPLVASKYCRHCDTDDDCDGYATESVCTEGQCTNEEGLLGLYCICEDSSDCATGRCDGFFEKQCRMKLNNDVFCDDDDDCESGWCKDNMMCGDPLAPTAAPKVTNVTDDPEPLPLVTTSPKAQPCDTCSSDDECDGGGICYHGLCTDSAGELPFYCGHCMDHVECVDGYYCAANGLIGSTGKFCQPKKINGARCNDNDVCKSGHCNILFRCESNIPEHLRATQAPSSDGEDGDRAAEAFANTASGGIIMWGAVLASLVIFVFVSCVMCRKDGAKYPCYNGKRRKPTLTTPKTGLQPGKGVDETPETCDIHSVGGTKCCGSSTCTENSLAENAQNESNNAVDDKLTCVIDPEMELDLKLALEHEDSELRLNDCAESAPGHVEGDDGLASIPLST